MTNSFADRPFELRLEDELDRLECDLLGHDDVDVPALTLPPEQQAALAQAVGRGLDERGCDNTLRAAREWAAGAGLDWSALQEQLEGNGGYCDCEVLLNVLVDPEEDPDDEPD